jgi:hypothetical protein
MKFEVSFVVIVEGSVKTFLWILVSPILESKNTAHR